MVRRESSTMKLDRVEIAFVLALLYWLNHQPMKVGRKPEYPEKIPDDKLQKMPHTTARKFKPQARLEPAQQHWWQARKTVCLFVGWLLNVPATCECISGTDLLR